MSESETRQIGSTSDSSHAKGRKKRVAIVSPEHWCRVMGGAEYQVQLLMRRLQEAEDVDIRYFAARTGQQTMFDTHEVVCVGNDGLLSKYGRFWDVFRLFRALGKFKPDVIYQRVGCSYTGVVAAYALRYGIVGVWHVANEADTDPLPTFRYAIRKPHHYLERLLFDFGRRRVGQVIVQSQRQSELLREKVGIEAHQMIRNFHPVPRATVTKSEGFTICWVANLKELKCPEKVFVIAEKLEELSRVRILMIGQPYPAPERQRRFEELLSRHKNVKYIAGLTQEKVNELLMQSQLLINTSPREGFSNVFIQAWMRGTPVLTLGVNPDGLLDDENMGGAYHDPESLAHAVEMLVREPEKLAQMARHCREVSVEMFSMRNADELVKLILTAAEEPLRLRAMGSVT